MDNTLRDQFAMAALTGLCASMPQGHWVDVRNGAIGGVLLSKSAYMYADAMLAERQKPKANEGAEK